ncbi:hypothetical protein UPYG_G00052050 [Umbra pygmaea]|uniref:Uncharacterized protein n=1 Tax=Umbra pygmaea TaxID=75934 RepID=A0ABD0X7C0_UMBPY
MTRYLAGTMNKKRPSTTSFSSPQPRSLRPRKSVCYVDESNGKAMEVQALQKNSKETVLKSAFPKIPHSPLQDCTIDPIQQITLAGDTTALKQGGDSVELSPAVPVPEAEHIIGGAVEMSDTEQTNPANQECKDTSGKYDMDGEGKLGIQMLLNLPPSLALETYLQLGPPPALSPSKGVKGKDWDSQTASEDERCGERNPQPRMEEEGDPEQQNSREDPGACWSDARRSPPAKKRMRMGMRGLGERERKGGVEDGKTCAKRVMTARRRAAEQKEEAEGQWGDDGGAALVAAASVVSSSDQPLVPSNLPPAPGGGIPEETVREEGEEEQLQSGDKVVPSSPRCEAGSGSDPATGEQPAVPSEEKENQEGDGLGSAEPDQSTPRAPTPSTSSDPLEEDPQGDVRSSPPQWEAGARVGEVLQSRDLCLSEGCVQTESEHQDSPPPPKEPGPEWDDDDLGQPRETPASGGSEHNIHCAPSDEASKSDDTSVRPFGAEVPGYVSDSLLNTIALLEEDEGPEGDEDATQLVCGLIKELSSLNRLVMVTDRELETFRRGNKTARPPPRRVFPRRRIEI